MAVTGLVAARTVFLEERVVSGLSVHFLKTPTCDRSIRARRWQRKSADDESAMAGCPWGFGASVRLDQTVEGHDQARAEDLGSVPGDSRRTRHDSHRACRRDRAEPHRRPERGNPRLHRRLLSGGDKRAPALM